MKTTNRIANLCRSNQRTRSAGLLTALLINDEDANRIEAIIADDRPEISPDDYQRKLLPLVARIGEQQKVLAALFTELYESYAGSKDLDQIELVETQKMIDPCGAKVDLLRDSIVCTYAADVAQRMAKGGAA